MCDDDGKAAGYLRVFLSQIPHDSLAGVVAWNDFAEPALGESWWRHRSSNTDSKPVQRLTRALRAARSLDQAVQSDVDGAASNSPSRLLDQLFAHCGCVCVVAQAQDREEHHLLQFTEICLAIHMCLHN